MIYLEQDIISKTNFVKNANNLWKIKVGNNKTNLNQKKKKKKKKKKNRK